MQNIELKGEERKIFKKKTQSIRDEGNVPASIYGLNGNFSITLNKKVFVKTFKEAKYTGVIKIDIEGKEHNVLVQEIQKHPVTDEILNVSFHEISLTQKVKAEVPFEFVGEAPAVKTYQGVVLENLHEIEVECLPTHIPKNIEIDISNLNEIGDNVLLKDIKLPHGVEFTAEEEEDLETAIVTIAPPAAEEVEETEEEVSPEDVEVINEKPEVNEEGGEGSTEPNSKNKEKSE